MGSWETLYYPNVKWLAGIIEFEGREGWGGQNRCDVSKVSVRDTLNSGGDTRKTPEKEQLTLGLEI